MCRVWHLPRQKPDLTAADCVSTSTPGFPVFCGTSAAAPHAAAIAALLFEAGGVGTTVAEVRTAMETGSIDIETVGLDELSGYGIVDAVLAANDVLLLPEPGAASLLGSGVVLLLVVARRRGSV